MHYTFERGPAELCWRRAKLRDGAWQLSRLSRNERSGSSETGKCCRGISFGNIILDEYYQSPIQWARDLFVCSSCHTRLSSRWSLKRCFLSQVRHETKPGLCICCIFTIIDPWLRSLGAAPHNTDHVGSGSVCLRRSLSEVSESWGLLPGTDTLRYEGVGDNAFKISVLLVWVESISLFHFTM